MISKILSFFNSSLTKKLTPFIFEEIPVLNKMWDFLNGKKTIIGRTLLTLVALSEALKLYFPEIPYITDVSLELGTLSSWFLVEFGIRHAKHKEEKEVIVIEEDSSIAYEDEGI